MATYIILNIIVIALVCLFLRVKLRKPSNAIIITSALLIILTAIFDNVIVGLSIVDYDPSKILGLKIGFAPVEDFMYAVLAVLLVPLLWQKVGSKHA